MLFSTFEFIFLFLPLTLLGYFGLARVLHPRASVWWLFGVSVVFFSWWAWTHTEPSTAYIRWLHPTLLLGSVLFNFWVAGRIRATRSNLWLTFGIVVDLLLLGWFKYALFAWQCWADWSGSTLHAPQIILPLGISFYTFTQIAFLCDARQGKAEEADLGRYGLFVTFYPHGIAGPILHHKEMMPQFADAENMRWNGANFWAGCARFSAGLFKKVILADMCAGWVSLLHSVPQGEAISGPEAWAALLAYAFRIYFDFSGYSDMAIGVARMFNIRLPENFDSPYRSESIVEFWRRWHMTLSRWLRDYLYIPLGGNRKGEPRRLLNLIITMGLGGLWHGAGWTFLVWGLFHGLLLVVNHAWDKTGWRCPRVAARLLTFLAVMFSWALFEAHTLSHAVTVFKSALMGSGFDQVRAWRDVPGGWMQWAALAVMFLIVQLMPNTRELLEQRRLGVRWGIALGLAFALSLLWLRPVEDDTKQQEFIYFRF